MGNATGAICLDILKDQWAAAMTLRTVLLSLQLLLSDPKSDNPRDAVVARQYEEHRPTFTRTAKHWATAYADAKHSIPEYDNLLDQLKDMGVSEEVARVALSSCGWDLYFAKEQICEKEESQVPGE